MSRSPGRFDSGQASRDERDAHVRGHKRVKRSYSSDEDSPKCRRKHGSHRHSRSPRRGSEKRDSSSSSSPIKTDERLKEKPKQGREEKRYIQ